MLIPCPHGIPVEICHKCHQSRTPGETPDPLPALEPLRAWVVEHTAELDRLSHMTIRHPHLHTDLLVETFPSADRRSRLEHWADPLCKALFDLAFAVAQAQPDIAVGVAPQPDLLDSAIGGLALALAHVVDMPKLGISVAYQPGDSRQKSDINASHLASSLLESARVAFHVCLAAFEAEEQSELDWLRTRPPVIQGLMLRFPPVCRVRATVSLMIPAPGRIGRVVSYLESGNVTVMDEIAWLADDTSGVRAECSPDQLVVVQYDGNKTPAWLARVFAGEDVPATNPGLEGKIAGELPVEEC